MISHTPFLFNIRGWCPTLQKFFDYRLAGGATPQEGTYHGPDPPPRFWHATDGCLPVQDADNSRGLPIGLALWPAPVVGRLGRSKDWKSHDARIGTPTTDAARAATRPIKINGRHPDHPAAPEGISTQQVVVSGWLPDTGDINGIGVYMV